MDNIDIRAYNVSYLRSLVGLVNQQPVLFNATIRENIAYGAVHDDVSMNEIINASRIANLHSFISSLPQVIIRILLCFSYVIIMLLIIIMLLDRHLAALKYCTKLISNGFTIINCEPVKFFDDDVFVFV